MGTETYKGFNIVFLGGDEEEYLITGGVKFFEIEAKFQENKPFVWLEGKFINRNKIQSIEPIK